MFSVIKTASSVGRKTAESWSRHLKTEVESEYFPSSGLVQDDAAQRDVPVDHLDAVVKKGETLANLKIEKEIYPRKTKLAMSYEVG